MTWRAIVTLPVIVAFIVCFLAGHYLGWHAGRYGMKPVGPDIGAGVFPQLSHFEINGKGPLQYSVDMTIDHVGCRFQDLSIRSTWAKIADDGELVMEIQLVKNESQYGAG